MPLDFQKIVLVMKLENVFLVMFHEDKIRTLGGVCISLIMLDTFNVLVIYRIEEKNFSLLK